MNQETWNTLSPQQKEAARTPATPLQLQPYKGDRVEVVDQGGETRRFWVGRSTGWSPIYLEVHNTRSLGGAPADERGYKSIRVIRYGPRR